MLKFAYPELLWLLGGIPPAILLFVLHQRWRSRKLHSLAHQNVLREILIGYSPARQRLKFFLQLAAFGLIVVAFAQPRSPMGAARQTISGGDVMVCLDISNSMLAEDMKPNRLVRARQAISGLLKQLDEEQVGLIMFAGEAYIQVPLTVDKAVAGMLLSTVSAGDAGNQGTAIGSAISLAVRSFGDYGKKDSHRSIILITDGEDHEGGVLEEAKLAAEQNIVIYTVGVGEPEGVPIPVYEDGVLSGYKKDAQGNTVVSKLNPETLAKVAEITGGEFFLSSNPVAAVGKIRAAIRKQGSQPRHVLPQDQYFQQYGWFAGAAMILLALELFLPNRRTRRSFYERVSGILKQRNTPLTQ